MKRILIIDDEPDLRDILRELLEKEGYQVDTASDGQSGYQMISQGGHDLVLLDIIMPKLDGITVLRELQKNPPSVPPGKIVMLSVLDQTDFVKTSLTLGAAGYLNKSVGNPQELVSQIKSLI